MRTIYAEYNINHDSIDVYTSAGYMLRIDCWKAEKNLKTTYGSECALTSLAVRAVARNCLQSAGRPQSASEILGKLF